MEASDAPGAAILTPERAAEVRSYLDQLLASPVFSTSIRRSQLLRYLVHRGLAGEGDCLNEYAIGVDVFGKPDSFDTRLESTVRSEFSRLRQKLREYYAGDGQADGIRIDFPQRSYAPVFTFRGAGAMPAPGVSASRWWPWAVSTAVVILATAAVGYRSWTAHPHPINAIVVLPFVNLSPDHQDDYLADGITEELTNDLAQSKDLRVVARTSASLFKGKAADIREVGRKLNVDTAIEGSIERVGNRIRITAQMNRTADGYHMWSHAYDSSTLDLLSVQEDISRSIAAAVTNSGAKVVDGNAMDSTRDAEAHDLYLRANYQRSLHTPESYTQALALFTQATGKDPAYVNAWIGIARARIDLVHLTVQPPDEAFPAARVAIEKALQLDPSCAEARGLLAVLIASYDWDWTRAEPEFRRSIADGARAPTRALYGALLAMHGRFREAHAEVRVAEDLDPLALPARFDEYMVFFLEHDFIGARRVLQGMLQQNPDQFDAHFLLGELGALEHNCMEARKELEWCARKFPSPITKIGLADASACEGSKAAARAYLEESTRPDKGGYTSPYESAVVYAAIGDDDKTLALLEKSAARKEMQILYIEYEPIFQSLRSNKRFIALEKRVGLVP
jgi:TolB-like protein